MFGFGVYFNVVTNGGAGGGAPATEIFTANTGVFGTGKYLTAPSDSSFNLGGGDFTLSTWLNFSAFQTVTNPIQYRWAGGGANVNSHILRYRKDTGKMQLVVTYTGSESNLVTFDWTWAPIVGTEYHIAVERTGADLKFMVDNVQVDATLNIGTNVIFDSPRDLWLGGSNSNDIYQESFIGELFGMGIYKKSGITTELYNEGTVPCYGILEQATKDACSIYVPDYNFTGFVGQELDDQSSFAHVITETGTIAFTGTAQIECLDDFIYSITSKTMSLTQRSKAPHAGFTLLDSSQTWTMRIKLDNVSTWQYLFATSGNGPSLHGNTLVVSGGKLWFFNKHIYGLNSPSNLLQSTAVMTTNWHHIRCTLDITAHTMKIHLDNVLIGSLTNVSPLNQTSWDDAASIVVGGFGTNTVENMIGGGMGQVRIWNRAISDAEGTIDYNGSATQALGHSELGAGQLAGLVMDVNFGSTNVIDNPIEDNTGNLTFSEVGTATYSDQGMFILDRNLG